MNSQVFNQDFIFNGGKPLTLLQQFLFSINELNIDDGVKYRIIKVDKNPNKEVNTYSNPGMDGINYVSDYARGGTITISMYVWWRNSDEFMDNLYKLKYEINKKNVYLRCIINNRIEQGPVVAAGEPTTFEHYNTHWIPIQLTFTYFNFLNNNNSTGLTYRVSGSEYRQSVFYKWYAPTLPTITLNLFKNLSRLKILNEANNDYIEINQSFSAGDILFLDFENSKIYVNSQEVLVDFDGKFFTLLSGENVLKITNNASGSGDVLSIIVQYKEAVY